MTVSTTISRISYLGNGSTTVFTFPFAFPGGLTLSQAAQELDVFVVSPTGVTTTLTFGFGTSNYQLSLNAPISPNPTGVGGSITYNPAGQPIPTGSTLVIQRTVPAVQNTSLENQGSLWQQVVEQSLDYLAMVDQQLANSVGLVIQAPSSDPAGLNYILPSNTARANMVLAFDANGNVVVTSGTGLTNLPAGQQTVSATWTFTGSPAIDLSGLTAEERWISTDSTGFYAGTITGGSGTTATLAANPTNYWTGVGCCTNDQTIVGSTISITGGGTTQVALISAYNASTRTVTISGNIYNSAGSLIGSNFNPALANGFTFTIGRVDFGFYRVLEDRNIVFDQIWNFSSLPQSFPNTTTPFTNGTQSFLRFNRISQSTQWDLPLTGTGNQALYISANTVWNSDPNNLNGQTPQTLSIFTLQSSGDTGNAGNFPSAYPVTYANFEAFRVTPHAYSGGVLQSNPYLWTAFNVNFGIGTGAKPDSPLEVRTANHASLAPPSGTMIHATSIGASVVLIDGYSGGSFLYGRTANGLAGSESGVTTGFDLLSLGGFGYGTTGYSAAARATMTMSAAENWSDTAQGTNIIFSTTQTGTLTPNTVIQCWASGGASVGVPADPGANSLGVANALKVGAAGFVNTAVSIPSGGAGNTGLFFSTTANFGIYFGNGAPTVVAADGSIYLNSAAAGAGTRFYIHASGAWVGI